jgi:IclR family transcriptional regulator, pca regulon regulatory protein
MRKSDSERRALRPKRGDYVEALARGLAILRAFGDRHRVSLSEMARLVYIPKPSVRRTLITLSDLGYVSSIGRQFELTPKVVTLAAAYLSSTPIVELLQPSCERISKLTGMSTAIAILDGTNALTVAAAHPSWPPMAEFTSGQRLSLFERDALFRRVSKAVPDTVGRIAQQAVSHVLRQGFAVTGINMPGFPALAVPLHRRDGRAFGPYGIALPSRGASREDAPQELVDALTSEAANVQSRLI